MNATYINYLKATRKDEDTIKMYTRFINDMLEKIGKPEAEITSADLVDWQSGLDNLSTATVANRTSAVRGYFKFLYDFDFIEKDPAKTLKTPEAKHKEKPYMDVDMVKAMVEAARTPRDKAVVLLIASTGIRVGELVALTLRQYFSMDGEDGREIILHETKRGNERTIYINDQTKEAIDAYLKTRHDTCDRLFVSFQRNPLNETNLTNTIKNTAKRAGLKNWQDITCHTLRSACATIMNDKGVPLPTIAKTLGHANVRTTMGYVKTSQHQKNEAMRGMTF